MSFKNSRDYIGRHISWRIDYTHPNSEDDEIIQGTPVPKLVLHRPLMQPQSIDFNRLLAMHTPEEAVMVLAEILDRLCKDIEVKSRQDTQFRIQEALGLRR
jgi:hypothetical protein